MGVIEAQREAITGFEDCVIDGWHRYRACTQLGIAAIVKEFDGDADPVAFVLSRNLQRRHLSASQRTMAVASCASWMPAHRPTNPANVAGLSGAATKTMADLAHDAGVGQRTMERAARVEKNAAHEVAQAVVKGSLSIGRAADIAGLPQGEQAAASSAPAAPPRASKSTKLAPAAPADGELQAKVAAQVRHRPVADECHRGCVRWCAGAARMMRLSCGGRDGRTGTRQADPNSG